MQRYRTEVRRRRSPARAEMDRRRLIRRRGPHCEKCGWTDPTGETLEADHIVPIYKGGADDISNKQLLCADCHKDKTVAEQSDGSHLGGRGKSEGPSNPLQR